MNCSWKVALALILPAAALVSLGDAMSSQALAQATAPNLEKMKADYRRPPVLAAGNRALVELGRLLFWDPRVSASGTTACATCHLPYLGWGVTDPRSRNDSGKFTSRKSQPLLGIGHLKDSPVG